MISQSGNVAVNALGSRRGIGFHTVVSTGNQAVLDASDWLARPRASATGVRSVALFLEADGDGARLAEALARCAERGVGVAVLKVGRLGGRRRAPPPRTPASLAGDQRVFRALVEEAGAAWADDSARAARARAGAGRAARPAARRGRARDPDLLRRRLGDRRRRGATELGLELPAAVAETPRAARRAAARRGDDRQPARLHLDDLGRDASCSPRSSRRSAPTRRSTSCCCSTTTRRARARGRRPVGARSAPGSPPGAERDAGGGAGRLDPARPARRRRRARARRPRGCRRSPACAPRCACAAGAASAARRSAAGCGRSPRRRAARAPRPTAATTAGSARPRRSDCSRERGSRSRLAARPTTRRVPGASPPRARLAGRAEALRPGAAAQEPTSGALALGIASAPELARRACALDRAAAGGRAGASLLVERMAPPGLELLVAARADARRPGAGRSGSAAIWTEALDDVAIIPLPASAERVARAIRSLRGAALLGGRGGEPVDVDAAAGCRRLGELLLDEGLDAARAQPGRRSATMERSPWTRSPVAEVVRGGAHARPPHTQPA